METLKNLNFLLNYFMIKPIRLVRQKDSGIDLRGIYRENTNIQFAAIRREGLSEARHQIRRV